MQRILFILPQLRGTQHSPPPNRHSRLRVANNQHRLRSCRASLGTAATERGARILERCRRQVRHRSHHLQPAQPRTQRHQAQLNIHSLVWHWVIIVSIPKPFVISDNSSQSIYSNYYRHNCTHAAPRTRCGSQEPVRLWSQTPVNGTTTPNALASTLPTAPIIAASCPWICGSTRGGWFRCRRSSAEIFFAWMNSTGLGLEAQEVQSRLSRLKSSSRGFHDSSMGSRRIRCRHGQ